MEVGNMEDINNMSIKDFYNLNKFLNRREKMRTHKPVELKQSQKDMIQATKERDK